jgi:hypothetical protein
MNSDTPRTDNVAGDGTTVPADFAADLERELNEAKAEVERLREALKWIAAHDLSGADLTVCGHIAHGFIGKARNTLKEPK